MFSIPAEPPSYYEISNSQIVPTDDLNYEISHSQIVSTNDLEFIEELLEEANQDSIVFWDVDQTLITPEDPILKPKWEKLLDQMLGGKCIVEEGKMRYIFREILMNAQHRLVDPKSLGLIQNLQNRGILNIAFSAAPGGKIGKVENFVDWRIDELNRYGFHFNSPIPFKELSKNPHKEFPPIFKSGILITSLHEKGPVLVDFLKTLPQKPKKIYFIDDQRSNVESVFHSLKDQIQVIGIHYTGASELPCELDENIARHQVDVFRDTGRWLPASEVNLSL